MKKLVLGMSILLLVGHLIPELGEIIEKLDVDLANTYVNPFWDKSYVFPTYTEGQPPGTISLKWFLMYWGTDLLFVITFFVLTKVAYQYSYKLFLICALYFMYHLFDFVMLWVNFKSSHWMYWMAHGVNAACLVVILFKEEKIQAKVKSII